MVALLLAALFQSAAPASTAAAPSAPPAKVAKLACRKETVVGSTIKKKICPRKIVEEVAQGDQTDAAQVAEPAPK
ncbi:MULTISPECIES: hypothetical protein [unclassified Phenylobacterium]|uniref:hypothetical protein n=1 Tax=unclassified Phenylobacterium TaxID=2640670 RepID=UPI000839FD18|nr:MULTISPECIES: hypothetical protein [unclassified Phenylobacterium]